MGTQRSVAFFVVFQMASELYRGRMAHRFFWSMKSLHSGKDDVSRFLKITPKLSYYKRVSRSGRTRRLEADLYGLEHLLSPKPDAQVWRRNSVFPVCCLICEMRVVMITQLTGQQQRSSQSISFLASATLNFVFCEMRRINSALPTLPVAGSWEKAEAQNGKSACPRSQNRLAAQEKIRWGVLEPGTPAPCHASTQIMGHWDVLQWGRLSEIFLLGIGQFREHSDVSSKSFMHRESLILTPKLSSDCKTRQQGRSCFPLFSQQLPPCVHIAPDTCPPKGLCHTLSCLRDLPEHCLLPLFIFFW